MKKIFALLMVIGVVFIGFGTSATVDAARYPAGRILNMKESYYYNTYNFKAVKGYGFGKLTNMEHADRYNTYYTATGTTSLVGDRMFTSNELICRRTKTLKPTQYVKCSSNSLSRWGNYYSSGQWDKIQTKNNNGWMSGKVE